MLWIELLPKHLVTLMLILLESQIVFNTNISESVSVPVGTGLRTL